MWRVKRQASVTGRSGQVTTAAQAQSDSACHRLQHLKGTAPMRSCFAPGSLPRLLAATPLAELGPLAATGPPFTPTRGLAIRFNPDSSPRERRQGASVGKLPEPSGIEPG